MSRVCINADPMPLFRADAVIEVNEAFARLNGAMMLQETAWRRKKMIALAVKSGGDAPSEFAQEAALRSLDVQDFADLILSKPDSDSLADARELRRQEVLMAIEACQTRDDIETVKKTLP